MQTPRTIPGGYFDPNAERKDGKGRGKYVIPAARPQPIRENPSAPEVEDIDLDALFTQEMI